MDAIGYRPSIHPQCESYYGTLPYFGMGNGGHTRIMPGRIPLLEARHGTHKNHKIKRISASNGKLIYQLTTPRKAGENTWSFRWFHVAHVPRFPLDFRASSWWKCTCPSRWHHECSHSSAAKWNRSMSGRTGPRDPFTNGFKICMEL